MRDYHLTHGSVQMFCNKITIPDRKMKMTGKAQWTSRKFVTDYEYADVTYVYADKYLRKDNILNYKNAFSDLTYNFNYYKDYIHYECICRLCTSKTRKRWYDLCSRIYRSILVQQWCINDYSDGEITTFEVTFSYRKWLTI